CNPGPTDGKIGPFSERAVADFQRDYNANLFHTKERQRTASDLEVNGKLDDLTRTALRDAYVAHFSTGLSDTDFQGPKFSGCGEFVPISDDPDHNRRVTLTVYPERSSPSAFPCVQGDASACDLDDQKPRRCRFYRKVVLEDEQLPPPTLADFEWLKLGDGRIHLSAVSSAPDDQEARFTVHKTTTEPAN